MKDQIVAHLTSLKSITKNMSAVLVGGAGTSLAAHFTDPAKFDFTGPGLHQMGKVAAGGAAIAVFHLWQSQPKP